MYIVLMALMIIFVFFCFGTFKKNEDVLKYNTKISEKLSNNGKYKAVKFMRNVNATTPFSYHLMILPKNKELKDASGNIYVSYEDFEYSWIDDILVIYNSEEDHVFKKITSYEGINISYITDKIR